MSHPSYWVCALWWFSYLSASLTVSSKLVLLDQSFWILIKFRFKLTADIANWKNSPPNASGFFAYGADGVLYGIILVLFIFIAFDIMMMSSSVDFIGLSSPSKPQPHRKIQYFGQTIERTIFLINTILCLCLVGMALALTVVQPIQLMVCKLKVDEVGQNAN